MVLCMLEALLFIVSLSTSFKPSFGWNTSSIYISFKVCFCEVLDYFNVIFVPISFGILVHQNEYLKGYSKVGFVPFEFKLIFL
ncbi:hypothetical protein ACE6H2_020786 [Prunus campanulata]